MKTVIYGLFCPIEGAVRYIGKSSAVEKRLKAHLYSADRSGRTHKQRWLARVLAVGLKPSLVILEEVDESSWQEAEIRWIAKARNEGWPLTNSTRGGDGASPLNPEDLEAKKIRMANPETRRKMSEAAKARWSDPEKRAKGAAALKSEGRRNKAREQALARATPEYRQMMSDKSRACWADPEKRARIVSGITQETREAVSASSKRMWEQAGDGKASRMLANLRSGK